MNVNFLVLARAEIEQGCIALYFKHGAGQEDGPHYMCTELRELEGGPMKRTDSTRYACTVARTPAASKTRAIEFWASEEQGVWISEHYPLPSGLTNEAS